MHIVVVPFGLFRCIGINSRLSIEKNNIELTELPYTNYKMILWNLYPVLPIVKAVFSEANQLNTLKGTTLKSVNHASKFTVLIFAISQ